MCVRILGDFNQISPVKDVYLFWISIKHRENKKTRNRIKSARISLIQRHRFDYTPPSISLFCKQCSLPSWVKWKPHFEGWQTLDVDGKCGVPECVRPISDSVFVIGPGWRSVLLIRSIQCLLTTLMTRNHSSAYSDTESGERATPFPLNLVK